MVVLPLIRGGPGTKACLCSLFVVSHWFYRNSVESLVNSRRRWFSFRLVLFRWEFGHPLRYHKDERERGGGGGVSYHVNPPWWIRIFLSSFLSLSWTTDRRPNGLPTGSLTKDRQRVFVYLYHCVKPVILLPVSPRVV